ncbi:MAG TPA: hypothetical protein VNV15_08575 [Opitutaceae bacterium]|nr:hypothetical protein [Opitutaceae bacterium]
MNRWKVGSHVYRIGKASRAVKTFQSANHLPGFGAEDWQSLEMERCFSDVEKVVGYTEHKGEILDSKKIQILARWLALHFVRSRRHREVALSNGRDYRSAVDLVEETILGYHGFFADFTGPVFITGDNPVALMGTPRPGTPEWFVAPLSPTRCIYVMEKNELPSEPGFHGLRPTTINQLILNAATECCLSFDRSLHLP